MNSFKTQAKNTLLLFLFVFSTSVIFGQRNVETKDSMKKVLIKMKNGDEFKGVILNKDRQTIVIKTDNGELNLVAANVTAIEEYTYTGKFSFPNPHDTRYFFGPSAIPVKQKQGYYQNLYLSTNFVNYGLTKNLSIGGGFEFISTITGNPIWFFTPKVGFELSEKSHLGGGLITVGASNEGTVSLGYGVYTYGTSESNVSIGAGYGYVSGELSNNPAIMLSGTHRVKNGLALLSENYIIPTFDNESTYLGIQGIRILSNNNAFDIGIVISSVFSEELPALPYVGYARAF